MKKLFLISLLFGCWQFANAAGCDSLSSCYNQLSACQQSNCGSVNVRYLNPIFSDSAIVYLQRTFACISDSLDPCADSNKVELKMDIYSNPDDCQCCSRPVVLLASSGGFHAMDKRSELMIDFCTEYARRGYVAVSMKYRTGYPDCCDGNNLAPECNWLGDHNPYDAIAYKAHQDATAAVRYLKSRADELGINPDQVFFGGSSAGGVLALHTAYLNESEIDPDLINTFGPLDKYGVQGYDWDVAGVLSLWGTIKDPNYLLDDGTGLPEDEPLIMFHGTCDPTYPYNVGRYLCFTDSLVQNAYKISGPQHIKETIEANSLPICYDITAGCGFAHGTHRKCAGVIFGGGGYLPEMGDFMVQKSAQFMYDHVLSCNTTGCTNDEEFICKPCYCARCQVVNTNADLEGCKHCSGEPKFGITKPGYLDYCTAVNQDEGFLNCQAVFPLNDSPSNPHESNVHMTAAILNWEKTCGIIRYELQVRQVGQSFNTIYINDTSRTSKSLFGLNFGATYEWQIRTHFNISGTTVSDWSALRSFTTICTPPESMITDPIGSGGARFNWSEILDAQGYQVRGRKLNHGPWLVFTLDANTFSLDITKLKPLTFYEWQMRTVCDSATGPAVSPWSVSNIFKTAKTGRIGYFEDDDEKPYSVFPNPAKDELRVQLSNGLLFEGLTLELFNLAGQSVYHVKIEKAATQSIDVTSYQSGLYQLILKSGEDFYSEKVAIFR